MAPYIVGIFVGGLMMMGLWVLNDWTKIRQERKAAQQRVTSAQYDLAVKHYAELQVAIDKQFGYMASTAIVSLIAAWQRVNAAHAAQDGARPKRRDYE